MKHLKEFEDLTELTKDIFDLWTYLYIDCIYMGNGNVPDEGSALIGKEFQEFMDRQNIVWEDLDKEDFFKYSNVSETGVLFYKIEGGYDEAGINDLLIALPENDGKRDMAYQAAVNLVFPGKSNMELKTKLVHHIGAYSFGDTGLVLFVNDL